MIQIAATVSHFASSTKLGRLPQRKEQRSSLGAQRGREVNERESAQASKQASRQAGASTNVVSKRLSRLPCAKPRSPADGLSLESRGVARRHAVNAPYHSPERELRSPERRETKLTWRSGSPGVREITGSAAAPMLIISSGRRTSSGKTAARA